MNIQGTGVSATSGTVDISAPGGMPIKGINVVSPVNTAGGGVSLSTQTPMTCGFTSGIEVDGAGDITLVAPEGSLVATDSGLEGG